MNKTLKKTLSIIVTILMIVTTVPLTFAADTVTVYIKNTAGWNSTMYAYCWKDEGDEQHLGNWPGTALAAVEGEENLYSVDVPSDIDIIIFNDGSNQTSDLFLPTDDKNCYDNGSEQWIKYTPVVFEAPPKTEINGETYYELDSAEDYLWFVKKCNDSINPDEPDYEYYNDVRDMIQYEYYVSYNAIMTADIVLNSNVIVDGELTDNASSLVEATPIANYYNSDGNSFSKSYYSGTFDGNGYSISGLYIDSTESYMGMFRYVHADGVIKDLSIKDSYVSGKSEIGGIVGENKGNISGCTYEGIVYADDFYAGGIASYNIGTIEKCHNAAHVYSNGHQNAGIVITNNGTVINCYNSGIIGDESSYQSGGIVGINNGSVENCYNIGAIRGLNSLGGIASSNQKAGTIKNCYYNSDVFSGPAVISNYNEIGTTEVKGKTAAEFSSGEVCDLVFYHSYVNSKCIACGADCEHDALMTDITRPVQNTDGTWNKGTYVSNCSMCGALVGAGEVERDHEGYRLFEEAAAEMQALIDSGDMLEMDINGYTNSLKSIRNIVYRVVYTEIEPQVRTSTNNLKDMIARINEGLADGSMKRADISELKSLLDELNALIDNDVSKLLPAKRGDYYNPNGYYNSCVNNKNLSQKTHDITMQQYGFVAMLTALIEGVKNGTALRADYTEIDAAIEDVDGLLEEATINEELTAELEEIKASLEGLKSNSLTSKADLESSGLIERAKAIATVINNCINGLHTFTEYVVTEEAKCGVAGNSIACCDIGCGATDEKEVPALKHIDDDGDYLCDHGCGYEFEKPAAPEQPDTPDEPSENDCDHLCHKSGFIGFVWKIVRFFSKLFRLNPVCECGAAHY